MDTTAQPGSGAHLNTDPHACAAAAPTDTAWLRLSAALTDQVHPVAGRADLLVVCEPGVGQGAPACFIREQATIEIDGTYLDVDLATIDPDDPDVRERFPVLWGLLVHEAAHAQHSCWDVGGGHPAVAEAASILEESRIEAAQIRRRPGDRRWLRASSTKILLTEVPDNDNPWSAAGAAALVLGRADAGVLAPDEVEPIRDAVTAILGHNILDQLTTIWQQAHRTDDFDTASMLDLGRQWCTVLGIDPHTNVPPMHGPSDAASTGTRPGSGGTLRSAAGQLVATIAQHDNEEAAAQADAERRAQQRDADRQAEVRARTRAAAAGAKVFSGKAPRTRRGKLRQPPAPPHTRDATDPERATARQLARALRAAAHREPTETVTSAAMPPGRLRTRAALTADAQRAAGQQPTAEPWRRTQRLRHPNPPIQVGICTDVSPSVAEFADPIASVAWITAQATAWAGGTSATVTFGTHVTAIVKPGQRPAQVRLFDIEDDTVGFPLAVDALDAALDLADPRAGARLLVVVSDGEFTDTERLGGQQRLDRLGRAGCALLWLGPPYSRPLNGGEQVILTDPARSGQLITQAATKALTTY